MGDPYLEGIMAKLPKAEPNCKHDWSEWKEVGRTGDWFHPLIVERRCKKCGTTETEDR